MDVIKLRKSLKLFAVLSLISVNFYNTVNAATRVESVKIEIANSGAFDPFLDYYYSDADGTIRGRNGQVDPFLSIIEIKFSNGLRSFSDRVTVSPTINGRAIETELLFLFSDGRAVFRPPNFDPVFTEADHGYRVELRPSDIKLNGGEILDTDGNPVVLDFPTAYSEILDFEYPAEPVILEPSKALETLDSNLAISGTHPEDGVTIFLFADDNRDGQPDNQNYLTYEPAALASVTVSEGVWSFTGEFLPNLGTREFILVAKDPNENLSYPVGTPRISRVNELSSESGNCNGGVCSSRFSGWRLKFLEKN